MKTKQFVERSMEKKRDLTRGDSCGEQAKTHPKTEGEN
jgi:hypothetical protein